MAIGTMLTRLQAGSLDDAGGHGELAGRHVWLRYYTNEPAPGAWVAVGVVTRRATPGLPPRALRMLVGSGRSEAQAIADLHLRFSTLDDAAGERPRIPAASVVSDERARDLLVSAS